jgi:hypothetical protein
MVQTPKEIAAIAKPAPPAPRLFHLVPKDLNEAMTFAKMVAESDLVPKDYKGKAGNCLIGMQYGAELGLPPLQALQNIAVINGKPGVYGELGKALLLSKGFKIEERDLKETEKNNEAWCKITRPDGQVTERTFTKAHAEKANLWGNNVWKSYPYRMMAWRAFWFAARDAGADVLKGIWGVEELRDITDTTATETTLAPREIQPPTEKAPEKTETVDTKTGEITEATVVNPEPPANGLTGDQRRHIVELMKEHGVTNEIMKTYLEKKYGITAEKPTRFVTQDKYTELCNWITNPQEELGV